LESDWPNAKTRRAIEHAYFVNKDENFSNSLFFWSIALWEVGAEDLSLNHWSHLSSFFLSFFFYLSRQSRLIGHNDVLLLGLSPSPQSPSHFLFQKTWNNQNSLFTEGRQKIWQYFEMKFNCFEETFFVDSLYPVTRIISFWKLKSGF